MKKIFLAFAVLTILQNCVTGQVIEIQLIDTSNYYNYYNNLPADKNFDTLTTRWLTIQDVVPVLMEEMKLAGHDWLNDFALYRVDSNKYIVLAIYSRKSNIGFLYSEGHSANPNPQDQSKPPKMNVLGGEYVVCEETPSGKPNFVALPKLPQNIFILYENYYWYQSTGDPVIDKYLITKDRILNILRQDVKKYLATSSGVE